MNSLIFPELLVLLLLLLLLWPLTATTSMSGHVSLPADAEIPSGQQQQQQLPNGDSWGNQLPDMLVAYYRQHAVHSLMLVVCHADIGELRKFPSASTAVNA